MISVSARPNVNQESDTAAKQMSPTCVCRNSFLHGPLHGPPHLGVTHESLFTGLPVAQPPFSLPLLSGCTASSIITCEGTTSTSQHPSHHQLLIAYQVMQKTLAWKANAPCFGHLLFPASFSPLSPPHSN